jgi:periplasmic protein TonB
MNALVAEAERPHRRTATLVLELDRPEQAPVAPKHQAGEYKRHSLAARYWGEISRSEQPIRHVAAAEAQAVVLRGLLQTPTDHRQRNPTDWMLSVALHILVVSAVVLAPLAFTEGIDLRAFQLTHLTVPKPPAAAPPSLPAANEARRVVRLLRSAWMAPSAIPKRVETIKDPPAPQVSAEGVIGGIPGGETGGVLGGILGGVARPPAAPTAATLEPKKTVHQVGGEVKPPRALEVIQPNYPPVARTARVEGVVVIDAIIDERGNVVEARAVSGPGLLIPAALKAIVQWKYEPTYLDGAPVPIQMEVQVEFHLH